LRDVKTAFLFRVLKTGKGSLTDAAARVRPLKIADADA
jgi:hypothetical protein